MTFLWPPMLLALLLLPPFIWLYLRVQQRRKALAAGLGGLAVKQPGGMRRGWLRRLPAVLFFGGLAALLIALARPQAEVNLPRVEGTVILVFDVSGSMAANDVEPTRIAAAQQAAREFILSQPQTVQIGVVTFSGSGFAVQTPTNDTPTLLAAIDRLRPQTGTSLGQGILVALNTIAVDGGLLSPEQQVGAQQPLTVPPEQESESETAPDPAATLEQRIPPGEDILAQLPEGTYPPAVIVLLSDGENNAPPEPLRAAQAAADRGVRIDALGFGTTAGTVLDVQGFRVHTALDEAALQQVVQAAGGAYYNAQSEPDPQAVYANLTPRLVVKPEQMEITSVFTGAGLLALLIGGVLSLVWFNRLP